MRAGDRPYWSNDMRWSDEIIVAIEQRIQKRCEEAERERAELLQELGNLLAIIHRDGGHYMSKHGVKKAIEDAHTIWAGLIDLEADNATLRKRLEPIEEWWDRNCSEYIRKKHQKWDASMYEAIEKAMELKEG